MQQLIRLQSYIDPEFEGFLDNLEREQLSAIGLQAKQDGLQNKPSSLHHYNVQIVKPLKSTIQKAIEYNHTKHQPISDLAIAQKQRATASENISLLEKEKNEKEKNLLQLKEGQRDLKAKLQNTISSRLKIIIPILFGCSEGVLIYTILEGASFHPLVTFLLAFVIALAAGFGLSLGANFIRKATTRIDTKKRYAIVLSIAFLVALALGFWRAHLYRDTANINAQIDLNNGTTSSVSFSPWPFVVISFISFLVALAFEVKYWQSDEEKKKLKMYLEKTKELKNAAQEYNDIKKEIDSVKATSTSDSGAIIRKQEYARSNEQRLVTLAQQIANHYEGINVEYRRDGVCPPFFGELINTDFKLYFSALFNNLKQKK